MESSVNYAKSLLPETLMRSVSSVQTSISRRILPMAQPRCFKVCTHSSSSRRCMILGASSLNELLDQAAQVFLLSCQDLTLVLEDDGTVVDSDDFFQSLPNDVSLMVLEKGQMWTESKVSPSFRQPKRKQIAKVTFDLYKVHPKEFLGCLNVRASLYERFTFSYDLRCTRAKHIVKGSLHLLTYTARLAGQLLLFSSASVLRLMGEDEC